MRDEFIRQLTTEVRANPDIMLLTGDLGFGVLTAFAEEFPDNYLNVGVAEQNMTLVATGLALAGRKIFTYSIGNFPTLRCLEMIRNDVCYHDLDVTVVSVGGGFSYGQLGVSHHATEDLAILRSLRDLTVLAPADLFEVRAATAALCNELSGPAFLRIDKTTAPDVDGSDDVFEIGRARTVRDGSDLTFIAAGGVMREVLTAADELERERGLSARVLSMHTVSDIDVDAVARAAVETAAVVVIEEHGAKGGLAGATSEVCMNHDIRPSCFRALNTGPGFTSIVGSQDFLRSRCGLDADAIQSAAIDLMTPVL